MNCQPGLPRDDVVEHSLSSHVEYLVGDHDPMPQYGASTPLLWGPIIADQPESQTLETAKSSLLRSTSVSEAARSLQKLANKARASKAKRKEPREPPPLADSDTSKVDFMGYERPPIRTKVISSYDPFTGLDAVYTVGVGDRELVTRREKVWDWIDWLWMRRRNCKICVHVIRSLRTTYASRAEWNSGREICQVHELLQNVKSCGLCAVLFGCLGPAEQKMVGGHRDLCLPNCMTTFTCTSVWRNGEVEVSLRLKHNMGSYPLGVEVKLLRRSDFKPFECSKASILRHLGYSTGSAQAWAAAFNWQRECTRGHKDCRRSDPTYLPSRVIDVGRHLLRSPRLVMSSELDPGTRYATLSHCWGQSMHTRLLSKHLLAFRKRIPWKELSRLFKEAFIVTRFLGLRYLWIDSLCIIQDSDEDWARESSAMSKVYSCGYCNIAATSSHDGSEGLFQRRNPLAIRPTKIPLSREDTKLGKRYWAVNAQVWQSNVENAPLNRRGWVCQERLLSPRTLHFGIDQLYWECRTQTSCEFYPTGLPYIVPGVSTTKALFTKIESQLLDTSADDTSIASYGYQLWGEIVEKYSRATLSFESDKLVAVAGLAFELQRMVKDEYCAGLWRKHFLAQLLWRANPSETKPGNRPVSGPMALEYIAPTWSWASAQCPVEAVYFDPDLHHPVAEIVHIDISLSNPEDQFGALKDAMVKIRGRLAKAVIIKRKGKIRLHFSPGSANFLRWMPESSSATQTSNWCISGAKSSNSRLGIYPNTSTSFEDAANVQENDADSCLYLLLLQMTRWSSYAGLILRRCAEDRTIFERWGSFQTNSIEESDLFENQFTNFDDGYLDEGLDFYEYDDGEFLYDVTVI